MPAKIVIFQEFRKRIAGLSIKQRARQTTKKILCERHPKPPRALPASLPPDPNSRQGEMRTWSKRVCSSSCVRVWLATRPLVVSTRLCTLLQPRGTLRLCRFCWIRERR